MTITGNPEDHVGVNNKKRQAGRERRRAREQAQGASQRQPGPGADRGAARDFRQAYATAAQSVAALVHRLAHERADHGDLVRHVGRLRRDAGPAVADLVGELLGEALARVVGAAVDGGWDPGDLAELVTRRDEAWLPMLAGSLHEHSRAGGRADPEWLAGIEAIAPQRRLLVGTEEQLAVALGLTALLAGVPTLHPSAFAASEHSAPSAEHPKSHQVRKLLAKAEKTDFGPEAEALVAKAQELISRYALERLLESDSGGDQAGRAPRHRRLWLERPYVRAKSVLVHEVALANHCRCALAEEHGFVLLVGHEADLDSVDMLATSLMVQAGAAMMRLGRGEGRSGARARSRAFRQSFLVAYATRIGERLQAAGESAMADHAAALPVLRDHDNRVQGAFEEMVPHTVGRAFNIGDYAGYDAGTVAADQARLDGQRALA